MVLYLTNDVGVETPVHVVREGNELRIAQGVDGTSFYDFRRPPAVPNASSVAVAGYPATVGALH